VGSATAALVVWGAAAVLSAGIVSHRLQRPAA
jgi:hypothetical protein